MNYSKYHVCYHISPILCTGVTIEARNIREAITKSNIHEESIIYVANLEEVHRDIRERSDSKTFCNWQMASTWPMCYYVKHANQVY
jgi:hypothetical protein